MNPLGKNVPKGQTNNPVNNILQFLNSGGNPQQMIQQLMQQNPNANKMIEQMKNMAGWKSPKEFAMQMAQQQGIDPEQIMQIARKMGLK